MRWPFSVVVMIMLFLELNLFLCAQSFSGCSVQQLELTDYGHFSAIRYVDVNVSEAKRMIEANPNLLILDVRNKEEYDAGHIENATLIPVDELEARLGELDKDRDTLVYCKAGGRSTMASEILIANGFTAIYNMVEGIRVWIIAGYWIEVFHTGSLVINQAQTRVIENCTYVQTGNMMVENRSTLSLRNAKFVMNMTQEWEYSFRIQNNSILTVEKSEITGGRYFPIYVFDNSTASFSESSVPLGAIEAEDETRVWVMNSSIYYLPCFDNSGISITNSTVTDLLVCASSEVYTKNSQVEQIVLEWSNANISISSLRRGYIEFWNSYVNLTISGDRRFNLTLTNSTIYGWSLRIAEGSTAFIANLKLSFVLCLPGKESLIEIHNCSIGTLDCDHNVLEISDSSIERVSFSHGVKNSILNTSVSNLRLYDFQGNLSLGKVTVLETIEIEESVFSIPGDAIFSKETQIAAWAYSNVTRRYNVVAWKTIGNPIGEVELILLDRNDTLVWKGNTDDLGRASFNLTFADGNYTDTLRLQAPEENYSTTIGFLSDTPIILILSHLPDLNGDGQVNILDISIVAVAFGTKLGDQKYNPIADLDGNKEINIIDVTKVAIEYGKST